MTYFRIQLPIYYRQRWRVSRLCSGREEVGPRRSDHRDIFVVKNINLLKIPPAVAKALAGGELLLPQKWRVKLILTSNQIEVSSTSLIYTSPSTSSGP